MHLTRDQFLAGGQPKVEDVSIESWPRPKGDPAPVIRLRSPAGDEFEDFLAEYSDLTIAKLRGPLIAFMAVNPDGSRMFSQDDVAAIKKRDSRIFNELGKNALRVAGLSKESVEEKKSDSENPPSGSSPTESSEKSAATPT